MVVIYEKQRTNVSKTLTGRVRNSTGVNEKINRFITRRVGRAERKNRKGALIRQGIRIYERSVPSKRHPGTGKYPSKTMHVPTIISFNWGGPFLLLDTSGPGKRIPKNFTVDNTLQVRRTAPFM